MNFLYAGFRCWRLFDSCFGCGEFFLLLSLVGVRRTCWIMSACSLRSLRSIRSVESDHSLCALLPATLVGVCAHIYIDSTYKIMRIFAHNIGTYMHARSTCAERSAKIYATYKHTRAHILHTLCAIIVVIRHTRQHIRPRDTSIWDKGMQRIVEHYVQSNDGTHTDTKFGLVVAFFAPIFSCTYVLGGFFYAV